MSEKKLNVYQKIMRAAARGKGVRLSSSEVFFLSLDHAIEEAARDEEDKAPSQEEIRTRLQMLEDLRGTNDS